MEKIKLKPCPKCKTIITEIIEHKMARTGQVVAYHMECQNCNYKSNVMEKLEELAEKWNEDFDRLTAKKELFDGTKESRFESWIK